MIVPSLDIYLSLSEFYSEFVAELFCQSVVSESLCPKHVGEHRNEVGVMLKKPYRYRSRSVVGVVVFFDKRSAYRFNVALDKREVLRFFLREEGGYVPVLGVDSVEVVEVDEP